MLVYRLVHRKYAGLLTASGLPGRWNTNGRLVLYTAENISLALLENMVYRAGTGFNDDFRIMVIQIPDGSIEEVSVEELPANWRTVEAYPDLQKLGNRWYDARNTLCLRVPSSILPENHNIILNTTHPMYAEVASIEVLPYVPDGRLEAILKKFK